MRLSAQDYERVAEAIRAAEQRTAAEIVCVLARRSSEYSYVPALWAAFLALAAPWPLMLLTGLSAREIYGSQIAVFVIVALLVSWPPLRLALTPRVIKRVRAHRAAIEQFYTRGVAGTKDRSGVLIFVSLAERYARIVADEGVASKISDAEWRAALDLLLANAREGAVADGFAAAIGECARLLAQHIPPGGRDELPDKIYVM
jgi:putative membrane protein